MSRKDRSGRDLRSCWRSKRFITTNNVFWCFLVRFPLGVRYLSDHRIEHRGGRDPGELLKYEQGLPVGHRGNRVRDEANTVLGRESTILVAQGLASLAEE